MPRRSPPRLTALLWVAVTLTALAACGGQASAPPTPTSQPNLQPTIAALQTQVAGLKLDNPQPTALAPAQPPAATSAPSSAARPPAAPTPTRSAAAAPAARPTATTAPARGLTGLWTGTASGEATVTEDGSTKTEPFDLELEIEFNPAGQMLWSAGRSGKVTITGPGQQLKYVDHDGTIVNALVREAAFTPTGGAFVIEQNRNFTQTVRDASTSRNSDGIISLQMSLQSGGLKVVLEAEEISKAVVTAMSMSTFSNEHTLIRAEGILKKH